MIAFSATLISCQKSNEALIEEYSELCKEIVEAAKEGDAAKIATLSKKAESVAQEIDKREFTSDEQIKIMNITSEMQSAILSGTGVDKAIEGMSGMMDSLDKSE